MNESCVSISVLGGKGRGWCVCVPVGREWVSECKHMVWLALLLPVFAVG